MFTSPAFFAFLVLLVAPPALSSEADRGVYASASFGRAKFRGVEGPQFPPTLVPFLRLSASEDDIHNGYKATLGYRANRYFSVEAGYADFGTASSSTTAAAPGFLPFIAPVDYVSRTEVEASSWFVDVVGRYPFAERFTAFAKLGLHRWRAEGRRTIPTSPGFAILPGVIIPFFLTSSIEPLKERGTDFKWGVGMQYELTKHVGLRLEVERFERIHNFSVDLASVGFTFRF